MPGYKTGVPGRMCKCGAQGCGLVLDLAVLA